MTHMRVSFKYSHFCIKMIILLNHCCKNNILCAEIFEEDVDEDTYVFVQNNEEEFIIIKNEGNNENFEHFTPFEFLQIPENTSENFQCNTEKDNLNILLNEQNELIAKIEDIFNKTRRGDDWENVDEQEGLKTLCNKFSSLTVLIRNIMVDSHLQLMNIYDVNLTLVFNNILNVLNIKNGLNEKIKLYRKNALKYMSLKLTKRNTMLFYNVLDEKYNLQSNKFEETSKCIKKFENTFDLALKLIEKNSKEIKNESFTIIRDRIRKILNMFDINQKSSLYKANKLINNSIEKSLIEIFAINNTINKFFHP